MKNLKEKLKKPSFVKSLIGGLVIGIGILAYQNIGLKNQNNYLYEQYKQTGKKYINSITKYNKLEDKKYWDSINLEMSHALTLLQMQREQINLICKNDSLWDEHLNLAKSSLESAKEKRDIFEKLIFTTEEREFYKSYANYLDSLLMISEFNKIKLDTMIFK